MSRENPTDFEMGLCTKEGVYYPESIRCMGCSHIGSDGNPDPKNDNCIYCSRNEDKDAQEWDESVEDNFDERIKDVEPEDPYYTWFDEDGGEHAGRDEP